jgi:hypothetical protein
MQLDFEWLDAPSEGDPLESATMARVVWHVGSEVITRVHDRETQSERSGIHIPLYPLVQWLVTHWWALLYEPWPFDTNIPEPGEPVDPTAREWLLRHCVRAATPGFAGPFVCIFSEGRAVDVISRVDRGHYPSTPVRFVGKGEATGAREAVQGALAALVTAVLSRLDRRADERVAELRADWQAICGLTAQEADFCRAAGRLGLDPFDVDGWPIALRTWFEQTPEGTLASAFVTDLLEAPDPPTSKPSQYAALSRIADHYRLTAARRSYGPDLAAPTAFAEGYDLAAWVRRAMNLSDDQRLEDLHGASEAACDRPLAQQAAVLPDGRVLAVTGWDPARGPMVVTRSGGATPTRRFLDARALHLNLRGGMHGPRLVTDARTWDQRASRAFGAELLAPRAGVAALYDDAVRRFGREEAELSVASHYNVSPILVRRQLDNQRAGAFAWS